MSNSREVDRLADVIGRNLRDRRRRTGTSQTTLADWMRRSGFGWSQTTVAQIEGGSRRRRVTIEELMMLGVLIGNGELATLLDPLPKAGAAISEDTSETKGTWLSYSTIQHLCGQKATEFTPGSETSAEVFEALRLRARVADLEQREEELRSQLAEVSEHRKAVGDRLIELAQAVERDGLTPQKHGRKTTSKENGR